MRRVVVTGLGMVTPLACGVEETWSRLLKGESGARKIETFDVSDLPAKIACQIPRGDGSNGTYNPDQWMEPKEQRRVDEFIVYAMCAARQALDACMTAASTWRPPGGSLRWAIRGDEGDSLFEIKPDGRAQGRPPRRRALQRSQPRSPPCGAPTPAD